MADLNVKITGFEGPLDLLLHLIQQYEMDIYDVPLAEVCDQYLVYVKTMQASNLEIAAEYLVMAATLLAIKSRQLLPQVEVTLEEEFEEEDPRDALLQQLLAYRKFKYAAEKMQEKEGVRQLYFDKEPTDLSNYTKALPLEKNQVTTIDLFLAFYDVLKRNEPEAVFDATVEKEDISVSQKVEDIRQLFITRGNKASFSTLLVSRQKGELVTTFLAVLELLKVGFLHAVQDNRFSEIYFTLQKGSDTFEPSSAN